MAELGDGIGIEVTDVAIRAVRLDHSVPGRLLTAFEVPVRGEPSTSGSPQPPPDFVVRPSPSLEKGVVGGLVEVAGRLGDIVGVPTSISWFPNDVTLQSVDITAYLTAEVEQLRSSLAALDVTSTVELDVGTHRRLAALRWDQPVADALVGAARRVGFTDPLVEPSPVSLSRLYEEIPVLVRRWAPGGVSWQAIVDGMAVVAAVSAPVVSGRSVTGIDATALDLDWRDRVLRGRLDACLDAASLFEVVGEGVRLHSLDPHDVRPIVAGAPLWPPAGAPLASAPSSASAPGASSAASCGSAGPTPTADDVASVLAVALGAAVGAAGLAGRPMPPVAVGSQAVPSGSAPDQYKPGPWVIERVGDEIAASDDLRPRWRQWVDAIFASRSDRAQRAAAHTGPSVHQTGCQPGGLVRLPTSVC